MHTLIQEFSRCISQADDDDEKLSGAHPDFDVVGFYFRRPSLSRLGPTRILRWSCVSRRQRFLDRARLPETRLGKLQHYDFVYLFDVDVERPQSTCEYRPVQESYRTTSKQQHSGARACTALPFSCHADGLVDYATHQHGES